MSPETTPSPAADRIGEAIRLARRIEQLRDAKQFAAAIIDDAGGVTAAGVADRISGFIRAFGDARWLNLDGDKLLVERLLVVATQLERRAALVTAAAEAELRDLFLAESAALHPVKLDDVLPSKKLRFANVADWQRLAAEQALKDAGANIVAGPEPHPAGAEFSSMPPARGDSGEGPLVSETRSVGLDVTAPGDATEGGSR